MDVYFSSYLNTPFVESGTMPVPTDADEIQNSRNGRMGLVFMLVAFFCFLTGNKLYFPKVALTHILTILVTLSLTHLQDETKREHEIAEKRTPFAKKQDLWTPNLWRKVNFMMTSFVIGTMMVFIIEMSLSWGLFGYNIW